MTPAELNSAEETVPFGPETSVFKVAGKMRSRRCCRAIT
jgi:predicted DNA-binding protein (MmcQ/YjbR family)